MREGHVSCWKCRNLKGTRTWPLTTSPMENLENVQLNTSFTSQHEIGCTRLSYQDARKSLRHRWPKLSGKSDILVWSSHFWQIHGLVRWQMPLREFPKFSLACINVLFRAPHHVWNLTNFRKRIQVKLYEQEVGHISLKQPCLPNFMVPNKAQSDFGILD